MTSRRYLGVSGMLVKMLGVGTHRQRRPASLLSSTDDRSEAVDICPILREIVKHKMGNTLTARRT